MLKKFGGLPSLSQLIRMKLHTTAGGETISNMRHSIRQVSAAAPPLAASFSTALVSAASHPDLLASQNVIARLLMFTLVTLAMSLSGPAAPRPAAETGRGARRLTETTSGRNVLSGLTVVECDKFPLAAPLEKRMIRNAWRLASLACFPLLLAAQSLQDFEKKVTEFTLANGLHFIVLERHDAPVVSFHSYVNSGAADDPRGRTGLAHMFEHMIGKGTSSIGTKNWPEEKKALEAIEVLYDRLEAERAKGFQKDPAAIAKLEAEVKAAIEKANSYVVPNEYVRIIEENGGVGFNASTANDYTNYFYDLPANRTELWFLMQSEWLRQPIYREFYKERDVVREERRMRIESSPQGKLQEMVLATAFTAHPYRTAIGWASDIENLRAKDAQEFFLKHYVPANITIAIAGDVNPSEIKRLADQYFSSIPAGPVPGPVRTVEPPQSGEKRVAVERHRAPIRSHDADDMVGRASRKSMKIIGQPPQVLLLGKLFQAQHFGL